MVESTQTSTGHFYAAIIFVMNTPLFIIGASNIFVALFCIGISIPLLKGRIKRNLWYGIRTPKAFVSEDNWKKINEYGGRAMIYWSIPVLVIGLVMLVVAFFTAPLQPKDMAWILSASLTGVLILGALVQTLVWSRHLPDK